MEKYHPSMLRLLLLLLGLVLAVAGCEDRGERNAPAGTIKASAAYVEHFGEPPTPEKGSCFARVGYLPLKDNAAQVRAVPFFLFRESDQLPLILGRLTGDDMALPPGGGMFNPFPPASEIQVASQDGGTVSLDVVTDSPPENPLDGKAIAAALTETAVQFEGIDAVRVLLNGSPLEAMPEGGYRHDPQRIVEPAPPEVVMVAGSWEGGAEGPEEILVNFDRPVDVQNFILEDAAGKKVEGEYFQSAFDMSVVIHPENPGAFREGATLRAEWAVTDRLSRPGEGAGEFALERHDHPSGGAEGH